MSYISYDLTYERPVLRCDSALTQILLAAEVIRRCMAYNDAQKLNTLGALFGKLRDNAAILFTCHPISSSSRAMASPAILASVWISND